MPLSKYTWNEANTMTTVTDASGETRAAILNHLESLNVAHILHTGHLLAQGVAVGDCKTECCTTEPEHTRPNRILPLRYWCGTR